MRGASSSVTGGNANPPRFFSAGDLLALSAAGGVAGAGTLIAGSLRGLSHPEPPPAGALSAAGDFGSAARDGGPDGRRRSRSRSGDDGGLGAWAVSACAAARLACFETISRRWRSRRRSSRQFQNAATRVETRSRSQPVIAPNTRPKENRVVSTRLRPRAVRMMMSEPVRLNDATSAPENWAPIHPPGSNASAPGFTGPSARSRNDAEDTSRSVTPTALV